MSTEKAILAGGAVPHRLGLSDTVLLFPEHLALLDGMDADAAIIATARHLQFPLITADELIQDGDWVDTVWE